MVCLSLDAFGCSSVKGALSADLALGLLTENALRPRFAPVGFKLVTQEKT